MTGRDAGLPRHDAGHADRLDAPRGVLVVDPHPVRVRLVDGRGDVWLTAEHRRAQQQVVSGDALSYRARIHVANAPCLSRLGLKLSSPKFTTGGRRGIPDEVGRPPGRRSGRRGPVPRIDRDRQISRQATRNGEEWTGSGVPARSGRGRSAGSATVLRRSVLRGFRGFVRRCTGVDEPLDQRAQIVQGGDVLKTGHGAVVQHDVDRLVSKRLAE